MALASLSNSNTPRLRLSDLHDEVLDQILYTLFSYPVLRRRHITHPHPAFPLALTSRRFLALFRASLHTIDALYPETYAPIFTCALGELRPRHIAALIRLAAPSLRVLRLPRDCVDLYKALEQVTLLRIPLVELAYSNTHANVKQRVESALFRNAASLRKLTIFAPTTVLKYISSATALQHLQLVGVAPEYISALTELLPLIGSTLRVLRIGFDNDESRYADFMSPLSCLSTFAQYICANLDAHLPTLHTLDVNSSRSDILYHSESAEADDASWLSDISSLHAAVLAAREHNLCGRTTAKLRHLAVRVTFRESNSIALDCLRAFDSIITNNVNVEMQIVGATVVFPAGPSMPYFKALQITKTDFGVAPDEWAVACDKIEILDVGTEHVLNFYIDSAEFRDKVDMLASRCMHSLRHVWVEVELQHAAITRNLSIYLTRLLEKAVDVERVSIRTGIVDFLADVYPEFRRLMSCLGNIRVLRLTNHPLYSAECKMAFGRNLPLFLSVLTTSCSKLECLFLESAMPVRAARIASYEVRELAMAAYDRCEKAVEDLEAALPNCDISTVRAQLQVWFYDLNPMPPSAWPIMRAVSGTIGRPRPLDSRCPRAHWAGFFDLLEEGIVLPQLPFEIGSGSEVGPLPQYF